jgi:uncharacterized protein
VNSKLLADGPERVFGVVFHTGEEVMAGLLQFAEREGVESGYFNAIGAFSSVSFGYFDWTQKAYVRLPTFEEQVELLSLTGNIALRDNKPMVHAHVVIGRMDGTAHGGHLMEAVVRPTLELVVSEEPAYLRRRIDPETQLPLIKL